MFPIERLLEKLFLSEECLWEKSLNPRDDSKNTIRDMKILGVYKPEYDPLIDVYSDLLSTILSREQRI
ncbi:hypothetical protein COF52_19600 [Bacillus pseudomycoides]|nr:hypothetical protein COF52_19600 [Bacillus pseudomycoides]